MPIVLMFIGFILAIGSLVAAYFLATLACSMNPMGCDTDGWTLFTNLMLSTEGLFFWAGAAAGTMFFLMGLRNRSNPALQDKP